MQVKFFDRVKETSTIVGTGAATVTGAETGFISFGSVLSVADTFYYCIQNSSLGEWETGVGTYSGANTITRTTPLAGSSGLPVNFSVGTKDIFLTAAAAWFLANNIDLQIPTAIKTSAYNANAGEFIPCDISGGSFIVTLPSAPAEGSTISCAVVAVDSTSVVTINTGGADVFNFAAGATSYYINLFNEGVVLRYQHSTGIWFTVPTAAPSNFATNFTGIDAQTPITNANISINYTTRVLTITPPLGYFNIFIDGVGKIKKYRKTTVNFPAFTDTSGMWYFYFDSTGTATVTQIAWTTADFTTAAPIYRILWNNTKTPGVEEAVAEYIEMHLNTISALDHQWYHLQGSIWAHGFDSSSNVLATGSPNADGRNAVIGLSTGTNVDDNLPYTITNTGTPANPWEQDLGNITPANLNATNSGMFAIFQQSVGGLFSYLPATRFPFSWNAGTNLPQYIDSTGTAQAVTNNNFFVYFIYATQNPRVGQALKIVSAPTDFTTITAAEAYTWSSIQAQYSILGSDPEIRPMYRMIFTYRTAYDIGTKKTRLQELQDIRKGSVTTSVVAAGSLPASSVTFIPTGSIVSTNVQAMGAELDTNKAPLASPVFTGSITTPIIKPSADSTTAIIFTKADGVTAAVTIDTTNAGLLTAAGFSGPLTGNASTASALAGQYIDWNATSGGTSIANKPAALSITLQQLFGGF